MLGWIKKLRFEEALDKMITWYIKNQDWVDRVKRGDISFVQKKCNRRKE